MKDITTFKDLMLSYLQKQGFSVFLLVCFSFYFYKQLELLKLDLKDCQSMYHEALLKHIEDNRQELIELKSMIRTMKE